MNNIFFRTKEYMLLTSCKNCYYKLQTIINHLSLSLSHLCFFFFLISLSSLLFVCTSSGAFVEENLILFWYDQDCKDTEFALAVINLATFSNCMLND